MSTDESELMQHYSRALDEIYALRAICAHAALGVQADLSYKTYPKSRRSIARERIDRLQAAARGERNTAYVGMTVGKHALREAGAEDTLTRAQWENETAPTPAL